MKKIAIFASGLGTNARKIIEHFGNLPIAEIALVVTNNPTAKVVDIAHEFDIPVLVLNRREFNDGSFTSVLDSYHIDLIILAGFLWLIPPEVVRAYPNKIVNIHPALLPKYGGKGMYGMFVHQAVARSGDKETGITVHYANENYDEGHVIAQFTCSVVPGDSPENIAKKVQKLEHLHFAGVIEQLIRQSA